ncbi:SufB/SufD family protein [Rhodobaculum claviforme]|uniref:Fe-S cluster assembly protein SufD n=1 Tax=Rhodobaculum claviforme TaxID=1549854 RepID=A0A934WHY6_9RHOB|nr:SufD family Fe-S cluster assembly protein [Rhodobaculum claviforme]MBK5927630.1 Fe-S cluster assembly protein SufD [Rhodobaculum claviforme]
MATRTEQIAAARGAATAARLAGQGLPAGGAWITAARRAALGRVQALGLPDRRDEYWKYTDPTPLIAPEVPSAEAEAGDTLFAAHDAVKLVFVDGRFDSEASDDPALAGLEIDLLGDAATRDIHWAREVYGVLEARGQSPVPRTLAALNTAMARDGVLIRATGKADRPVSLIHRHTQPASDAVLHHCVKLEPGAEVTLLEQGPAGARVNTVLEVDVADGARFHHVRAQGPEQGRRIVTHVFARLGEGSVFKSFTATVNGRLTRNECVLELLGRDGVAHVAGAAVGGADVHQDDTVFITHAGEACESRQVYKKVLRGGARGVFQGKILVHREAQLTDGYQISQSLLLDEDSQFLAKPELEIYADDVKCSHGSTSGAIDPVALFYLRSRGVPEAEAQALLVLAFLAEALAEVEDDRLAEDLRDWFDARLSQERV